ncbi:MAG TPA: transketolase [Cyclobacteriaceae bacterium]
MDFKKLADISSQVRRDIVRMVYSAKSGHPGGSLGCTDFLVSMYFNILNHQSSFNKPGDGEDFFFISNGHISPVWYSVLARSGYFDLQELTTFRKINSRLQGHPATEEGLPGIRVASGSLGQGLSIAIGAAEAKKLDDDPNWVFVLLGDGELQEGQVWEAAMYGGNHKLDNLIAVIDYNGQQIDGPTKEINDLGDIKSKWLAFGWEVLEMDGNDFESIHVHVDKAKQQLGSGKPKMIIMSTIMGKGVDFMEGSHKWHGVAPNEEQYEKAMIQLKETLGDY